MLVFILWITLFFQVPNPPFKAIDEFEVKVDLQIKSRPFASGDSDTKIDQSGRVEKKKSEMLPYLALNLKLLKLSAGEVKAKIFKKNGFGGTKKIKEGGVLRLDMGFIPDIKQGIVSNEYNIVFYDAEKKPVNHVHIIIGGDGGYFVNDILCGKF